MSKKDNLLKEAIADAKTVRETAEANARLILEEAFSPQLTSMISARLRNEAEGVEGDAVNEEKLDSSDIGGNGVTVDDPAPKEPSKAASDSSHIQNPGQEIEAFGKGTTDATPIGGSKGSIKEAGNFGAPIPDETSELDPVTGAAPDAGLDVGPGAGMDGIADTPDELDLEAIIRELELDIQNDDAALAADDTALAAEPVASVPEDEPKLESFQDVDAGKKVNGAFDGALKETVAGKSGDGVFHDAKDLKSVEGVPGGKKVSPGQEVTGTKAETMTEELDLDEILREIESEEASAVAESQEMVAENTELKRALKEHRDVIQYLRKELQETNMLNAKLLYTNKLFKGFDLKTEQKVRIVETFDRASTLREVKLVYATLAEGLAGKISGTRKSTAKAITEGMASKTVGSTASKTATILAEGDVQVARWQKIAGITKK